MEAWHKSRKWIAVLDLQLNLGQVPIIKLSNANDASVIRL
jgi:hypothetical protein